MNGQEPTSFFANLSGSAALSLPIFFDWIPFSLGKGASGWVFLSLDPTVGDRRNGVSVLGNQGESDV
jgi:hypothetical protein